MNMSKKTAKKIEDLAASGRYSYQGDIIFMYLEYIARDFPAYFQKSVSAVSKLSGGTAFDVMEDIKHTVESSRDSNMLNRYLDILSRDDVSQMLPNYEGYGIEGLLGALPRVDDHHLSPVIEKMAEKKTVDTVYKPAKQSFKSQRPMAESFTIFAYLHPDKFDVIVDTVNGYDGKSVPLVTRFLHYTARKNPDDFQYCLKAFSDKKVKDIIASHEKDFLDGEDNMAELHSNMIEFGNALKETGDEKLIENTKPFRIL
jgi:hypothetical protein